MKEFFKRLLGLDKVDTSELLTLEAEIEKCESKTMKSQSSLRAKRWRQKSHIDNLQKFESSLDKHLAHE